jgi:hypothetical protein
MYIPFLSLQRKNTFPSFHASKRRAFMLHKNHLYFVKHQCFVKKSFFRIRTDEAVIFSIARRSALFSIDIIHYRKRLNFRGPKTHENKPKPTKIENFRRQADENSRRK